MQTRLLVRCVLALQADCHVVDHKAGSGLIVQTYCESILHLLLGDVAAVICVKVAEGIIHGVLLLQMVQVHSGSQELLIVNATCNTLEFAWSGCHIQCNCAVLQC